MTNPLKTGLFQVEEIPVKSLVTGEVLRQIEKRISKKDLLSLMRRWKDSFRKG